MLVFFRKNVNNELYSGIRYASIASEVDHLDNARYTYAVNLL